MRQRLAHWLLLSMAAALILAGCSQAAPAATPTKAPAAPTAAKAAEPTKPAAAPAAPTAAKAAEPTKPAAAPAAPTKAPEPAKPTAAAAAKSSFPEKGKAITFIVPFSAGGGSDIAVRVMSPLMEKDLGVPVQPVTREGAGGQVGFTEMSRAKPDGYTIGNLMIVQAITSYLDPERKAIYTRKDFTGLGNIFSMPIVVSVLADSPIKSLKELVDAAKAKPGKVNMGSAGILGPSHLGQLQLQKSAGISFASVHFDGGAKELQALLGGHLDAACNPVSEVLPHIQSKAVRVLAVLDRDETKLAPGVKTAEAQGYKSYMASVGGVAGPAGMPKDVVDTLGQTIGKVVATDDYKKKMDELGYNVLYLNPDQFMTRWGEMENEIKPLMELAKLEQQ